MNFESPLNRNKRLSKKFSTEPFEQTPHNPKLKSKTYHNFGLFTFEFSSWGIYPTSGTTGKSTKFDEPTSGTKSKSTKFDEPTSGTISKNTKFDEPTSGTISKNTKFDEPTSRTIISKNTKFDEPTSDTISKNIKFDEPARGIYIFNNMASGRLADKPSQATCKREGWQKRQRGICAKKPASHHSPSSSTCMERRSALERGPPVRAACNKKGFWCNQRFAKEAQG